MAEGRRRASSKHSDISPSTIFWTKQPDRFTFGMGAPLFRWRWDVFLSWTTELSPQRKKAQPLKNTLADRTNLRRLPGETPHDLHVVGSTLVPDEDDLPRRLNPIYQRRDDASNYLLPLDEECDAPPRLARETPTHIHALASEGLAVLFEKPIEAHQNHWLLQIEARHPPEYLHADVAPIRLRAACETSLAYAARAVQNREHNKAVAAAWYARRADVNDPLPLLALIGLLRRDVTPGEFRLLENDLKEYSILAVDAARRRIARQADLAGLVEVIKRPTPEYLKKYPAHKNFIKDARNCSAPAP